MRSLSPHPLLFRGSRLKTGIQGVGVALLGVACLAGCAKFPASGSTTQSQVIRFRFTMRGPVQVLGGSGSSTVYIYAVAIRATTDPNPSPDKGPLPILTYNANGLVTGNTGGGPTHYVLFDSQSPTGGDPYKLFAFNRITASDLDSAPDLNTLPVYKPNAILNYIPYQYPALGQDGPTTLGFDVFLSSLVVNASDIAKIKTLQINFLTRSRLSTSPGTQTSSFDSLGDNTNPTGINQPLTVYLNRSGVISGVDPQDVSDPALDFGNWSVEVVNQ